MSKFNSIAIGVYKSNILLAEFALCLVFGALAVTFLSNNKFETSLLIPFFGVLITIANVSFSFARTLDDDKEKEVVNFAAESLLHAAIILVYTSAIRYTMIEIKQNFPMFVVSAYGELSLIILTACSLFFLLILFLETNKGLISVYKFLELRRFKRK